MAKHRLLLTVNLRRINLICSLCAEKNAERRHFRISEVHTVCALLNQHLLQLVSGVLQFFKALSILQLVKRSVLLVIGLLEQGL